MVIIRHGRLGSAVGPAVHQSKLSRLLGELRKRLKVAVSDLHLAPQHAPAPHACNQAQKSAHVYISQCIERRGHAAKYNIPLQPLIDVSEKPLEPR